MTKREKLMERCPRFDYCSAPVCPLDFDSGICYRLKGEELCRCRAKTRFNIARDSNLKYKGLKKIEWFWMMSGAKRFKDIFSYLKKNKKLAINEN